MFQNCATTLLPPRNALLPTFVVLWKAGLEVVAFRTKDGAARVMDAYCPHLGANLGVMGRVVEDCIECPFHGWRFRGVDGVCAYVPYSSKTPEFAKVKTWQVTEVYGLVLVWYHADGEDPTWDMVEEESCPIGRRKRTGLWERRVYAHIQDIAENGADASHFNHLHKASTFVGPEEYARVSGDSWACRVLSFEYDVKWNECGVKTTATTDLHIKLFGRKCFTYQIYFWQLGPAVNVVRAKGLYGDLLYVLSFTPQGPLDLRIAIQTFGDTSLLWPARKFMESATGIMLDRDIIVWNQKAFLQRPLLVKEDHAIRSFRKWYSQFYSSKSLTWQEVKEKTLYW
ncbi:hypothetical protein ISCGN_014658 [Ixodes scapularis]